MCLVFPMLHCDMYAAIKLNRFRGFSTSLIRKLAIQVLIGLQAMQAQNIVHADLKPENIMLMQPGRSAVRIIDMGSGCYANKRVFTYIQSRFYRAPEVIIGLPYSFPIDMWSFACICAELYTGWPLFGGENERDQLNCIAEVLGAPPSSMVKAGKRRKHFFQDDGSIIVKPNSKGVLRSPGTKSLLEALHNCADSGFVSFLQACLQWRPGNRLSPAEALRHPWMRDAPQHLKDIANAWMEASKGTSEQAGTPTSSSIAHASSRRDSAAGHPTAKAAAALPAPLSSDTQASFSVFGPPPQLREGHRVLGASAQTDQQQQHQPQRRDSKSRTQQPGRQPQPQPPQHRPKQQHPVPPQQGHGGPRARPTPTAVERDHVQAKQQPAVHAGAGAAASDEREAGHATEAQPPISAVHERPSEAQHAPQHAAPAVQPDVGAGQHSGPEPQPSRPRFAQFAVQDHTTPPADAVRGPGRDRAKFAEPEHASALQPEQAASSSSQALVVQFQLQPAERDDAEESQQRQQQFLQQAQPGEHVPVPPQSIRRRKHTPLPPRRLSTSESMGEEEEESGVDSTSIEQSYDAVAASAEQGQHSVRAPAVHGGHGSSHEARGRASARDEPGPSPHAPAVHVQHARGPALAHSSGGTGAMTDAQPAPLHKSSSEVVIPRLHLAGVGAHGSLLTSPQHGTGGAPVSTYQSHLHDSTSNIQLESPAMYSARAALQRVALAKSPSTPSVHTARAALGQPHARTDRSKWALPDQAAPPTGLVEPTAQAYQRTPRSGKPDGSPGTGLTPRASHLSQLYSDISSTAVPSARTLYSDMHSSADLGSFQITPGAAMVAAPASPNTGPGSAARAARALARIPSGHAVTRLPTSQASASARAHTAATSNRAGSGRPFDRGAMYASQPKPGMSQLSQAGASMARAPAGMTVSSTWLDVAHHWSHHRHRAYPGGPGADAPANTGLHAMPSGLSSDTSSATQRHSAWMRRRGTSSKRSVMNMEHAALMQGSAPSIAMADVAGSTSTARLRPRLQAQSGERGGLPVAVPARAGFHMVYARQTGHTAGMGSTGGSTGEGRAVELSTGSMSRRPVRSTYNAATRKAHK